MNNLTRGLPWGSVTECATLFQLMGDPSRLRVILACLSGPVPVGRIADQLGLSPSLVSHHLRLLRGMKLVQTDRQGTRVFYQVTDPRVLRILSCVAREHKNGHSQEAAPVEMQSA